MKCASTPNLHSHPWTSFKMKNANDYYLEPMTSNQHSQNVLAARDYTTHS